MRINAFWPGDALVLVPQPELILGYCDTTDNNWAVYVAGPMAPPLRTAVQEGHLDQKVLLVVGTARGHPRNHLARPPARVLSRPAMC